MTGVINEYRPDGAARHPMTWPVEAWPPHFTRAYGRIMVTKLVKASALLLAAVAALALSGSTSATAAPASFPPGYSIHTVINGNCLDADLNTIWWNPTVAQTWGCNDQPQQKWIQNGDRSITEHYNGKCLDADVNGIGSNGTVVQVWDCNGSGQQKWYFDDNDLTLHSAVSGRCLTVDGGHVGANGARLSLWDCDGSAEQRWYRAL